MLNEKNILIIGPIPHIGVESTYGGTTILTQSLINYCKENNFHFYLVQSNKYLKHLNHIRSYFYVIYMLLKKIKSADIIMINSSNNGVLFLSPVVFMISKFFKKKFIFRKFGGNFREFYEGISIINKIVLKKTIFKADLLFFETKEIVKYVKETLQLKTNCFWLPNVRENQEKYLFERVFRKRFVFISHVKRDKGIFEILECSKKLPDDVIIDVFGPFTDTSISELDFSFEKVNYQGAIAPKDVIKTLNNYDVLLLPTYHDGEGYPGIIIEAMSIGMPSISTNWKAIPELFSENNGIIIEPKNVDALYNAIISINESNYVEYCANSLATFSQFDERYVYPELMRKLLNC